MRLCDDRGMVSNEPVLPEPLANPGLTYLQRHNHLVNATPDARLRDPRRSGEPFHCTGHAHLAGEHIECTSPAHLSGIIPVVPDERGRTVLVITGAEVDRKRNTLTLTFELP